MSKNYDNIDFSADHKAVIRREGLHGMSPDELSSAQKRARDAGRHALADTIGDIRVKVEEHADTPADSTPAGKAKRASKARRVEARKRRNPIVRAARRAAIDTPSQAVAGRIDTVSGAAWWYVGLIVTATFVTMIVKNPGRFTSLTQTGGSLFNGLVYPKAITPTAPVGTKPATVPATRRAIYA